MQAHLYGIDDVMGEPSRLIYLLMSVRSQVARSMLPPGRWYKLVLSLQACTEVSRGQRNPSKVESVPVSFTITIVFRSLFLAIASCCGPVVGDGEESVLIPKFST